MPVRFACECGKQYRVSEEHAGKTTKCKACGAALTIPAAGNTREAANAKANDVPPVAIPPIKTNEKPQAAVPPVKATPPVASPPPARHKHVALDEKLKIGYQPLLTPTGKKKTMGNMAIRSELKSMKDVTLLSSDVYQVGQSRSVFERLKASAMVGPVKVSETDIDSLQLFHFRDAFGEFAAIVPFDNGMIAPIEFVARVRGRLPSAIVLMKQSGGKIALEAGVLTGGPIGKLLEQVGTRVESVWIGCDGSVPSAAQKAQSNPKLSEGLRWEGKIGGGPVSTVYRLNWGIQALPLDDESFLLVAQSVPKQKMLGLQFGISFFREYRQRFSEFVANLNDDSTGEFGFHDPSVWLPATIEVLKWVEW